MEQSRGAGAEDMDCGRYVLIWTYRATMTQSQSALPPPSPGLVRTPRPSQRSAEPESSPVTVHRLANRELGSIYDCPRAATNCTLSLSCHLPLAMGKSQSKLSPEQLADLQKHTYCACVPLPNPSHSQDMPSSR